MKEIFIDCGSNLGQGYETLKRDLNLDDHVYVYMFEPNVHCYKILCEKYHPDSNQITIYNKAVWDKEEERILNVDFEPGRGEYGATSNILQEKFIKPPHVKDEAMAEWPPKYKQTASCIDLSKFIKDNFNKEDKIHLKLDIEGAEFRVLNKLVEDDTISYLNTLAVEWHDEFLKEGTDIASDEKLIEKLDKVGITITAVKDKYKEVYFRWQVRRHLIWLIGQQANDWELVPGLDPETGFNEKKFVEAMYKYKIKYIPWH